MPMTAAAKIKPVAQRDVTITRVYDAPRELVFSLWTDVKHLAKWWGPHGFTNPRCEADPRPGGKILIHMQAPDGGVHPMGGTFHEVVPHERIVFTSFVELPDSTRVVESHNTVLFEEQGKRTKMILHARAVGFTAMATRMLAGMEAGWATSLDKLAGVAAQENGNRDAADQIAIRAIFGDRTNALFGKVADLALKHFAPDVVSYDLAPPLQHVGIDKAALEKWFATWDGLIGWAMGDLDVQIDGDLALAHGLGHMMGTKTDGEKADLWTRVTVGLSRRDGRWQIAHQHISVPFLMDGSYKAAVDLKP
jgi:PhnB protein